MSERNEPVSTDAFLAVYNDRDRYPALADVAQALGLALKTVQNRVARLRKRLDPERIIRRDQPLEHPSKTLAESADAEPAVSVQEHAQRRSGTLSDAVRTLLTLSDYPVVNPQALVVEPQVSSRYDRTSGQVVEVETTPRTWLSETLRVAPVLDVRSRRFLFTGAQNDCPVDSAFWQNLMAYAAHLDAEIVVGPWTYETAWWSETSPASRAYDPAIQPYLCFGRMDLAGIAVFFGDMNTLPTANRPVSDMAGLAGARWGFVPHPRLQLVSVPSTDPWSQAVQIMSTGTVTRSRVAPRKTGIKALEAQVLGATLVEFDAEGRIFCRQILADEDGSFQDLEVLVRNGQIETGEPIAVLVVGDLHIAKTDGLAALGTFGVTVDGAVDQPGSMIEVLCPDLVVLHDIHDHQSRNHHHVHDVTYGLLMHEQGRASVEEEVERAAVFLELLNDWNAPVLVVESNHDLALDRWVREARYRTDPPNFLYGLRLDLAYHEAMKDRIGSSEPFSLLEWAVRTVRPHLDHVRWAYDGASHRVGGVELGHHGFRGSNGAKGTVTGFARLGVPMTIGDKHSPAILDDVYGAGAMQLRMDYNKGPSGWAIAHVIQYRNGKRTIITLQDGFWRAMT